MERSKNRKDLMLIILAVLMGVITFLFLLPSPPVEIVVAARPLKAGQVIREADLVLQTVSQENLPEDTYSSMEDVIGKTLAMDRARGDLIRSSALGEPIQLQPNERAMTIEVNNATGLAGLLKPGDRVGVTAVISNANGGRNGSFAKATMENLRVLYLSPEFEAKDAVDPLALAAQENENANLMLMNLSAERSDEGVVMLAVPIEQEVLIYHLSAVDADYEDVERAMTALELLALLDQSPEAALSLYLMPEDPIALESAGVWLQDLLVMPEVTPTPVLLCDPTQEDCPIVLNEETIPTETILPTPNSTEVGQ